MNGIEEVDRSGFVRGERCAIMNFENEFFVIECSDG